MRTETTINNTYDFTVGRLLSNLPALREIGFSANRRLLRAQYLSHDCLIGEDRLQALTTPVVVDTQRAAGLRFADRRTLALMQALCLFTVPAGFRHRDLRTHVADLLGQAPPYGAGAMTYDLRRLRLHGLIERVPRTHRYRVTEAGATAAVFYTRLYVRALRPAFSLEAASTPDSTRPSHALARLDDALSTFLKEAHLAA